MQRNLDEIDKYQQSINQNLKEVDKYHEIIRKEHFQKSTWLEGYQLLKQTYIISTDIEDYYNSIQDNLKDMKETLDQLFKAQDQEEIRINNQQKRELQSFNDKILPNNQCLFDWPNLRSANLTIGFVISTKDQHINMACFSPDSKTLLLALSDGYGNRLISSWDLSTKSLSDDYNITSNQIHAMQFTFDSKYILTADKDYILRFWTKGSLTYLSEIVPQECISEVQFSPTKYELIIRLRNELQIWDVSDVRNVQKSYVLQLRSLGFYYSPNGKFIITIVFGLIEIWSLKMKKQMKKLKSKTQSILDLQFNQDSSIIIILTQDFMMTAISLINFRRIYRLYQGKEYGAWQLSADSTLIAQVSHEYIHVWNTQTRKRIISEGINYVSELLFSKDGRYLLIAYGDQVKIYNII